MVACFTIQHVVANTCQFFTFTVTGEQAYSVYNTSKVYLLTSFTDYYPKYLVRVRFSEIKMVRVYRKKEKHYTELTILKAIEEVEGGQSINKTA